MSVPAFAVPPQLEAQAPPEARGRGRDEVRLMVVARAEREIVHASFRDLPGFLNPGDLLVVNNSATLPAAVPARLADGDAIELRFATPVPGMPRDRWWVVEPRASDGSPRLGAASARRGLELPGGAGARIVAPYAGGRRLAIARLEIGEPVEDFLLRYGRPIRYGYVEQDLPLDAYQTAFALEPGSAEMASAGRPLSARLVAELAGRGILISPITLHAGVSSPERDETPIPERFKVPGHTARLVNAVRGWGGRVVAVGTTVVRALETAADPDGAVSAAGGWTSEVITAKRGLRAVDGLLTGWHEPQASHLRLLEAALGGELLERSYSAALRGGYLWHEFGDSQLILR